VKSVLVAAAVALAISLLGTSLAIRFLIRQGYGQLIRDDGPTSHHTKRGTPTMGGAVIIVAALLGYTIAHLTLLSTPTVSALLVLYLMTGLGLVGFVDDYIKVSRQRSLGLRARSKLLGQSFVALSFAVAALHFPDRPLGLTPASTSVSFIRDTGIALPAAVFLIWAYLLIAAVSNGVNLTDGLDGLATGASAMVFGSYVLIGVWQFGQSCTALDPGHLSACYEVRDPLDLAVVAASLFGACFGFLWWNASPARIFMGDTGSLAIGGAIGGLAICSRTELLLPVSGGLFVLITASVIVQVGFFRLTGRRVFRMAPLQHHFELLGWGEVTIVIRFWIIAGLCVGAALGVFYAEWVAG
jgi:phospho-N-acetylmuramoyl-pentapeptide-transferase